MKRYLLTLLLAALSAGVFLACNDDDDDGGDPSGSNNNNPSAAFQVTVDGTQRVYTANDYQAQFDSTGGGVWVHTIAGNADDGTNIILTITHDEEVLATKTYEGSNAFITITEAGNVTFSSLLATPNDAEITITAATASTVSGSFSGTLAEQSFTGSAETRVLTDGSFSDIGQ